MGLTTGVATTEILPKDASSSFVRGGQHDLGVHVRESLPKVATEVFPRGHASVSGFTPAATQHRRPVERPAASRLRHHQGQSSTPKGDS